MILPEHKDEAQRFFEQTVTGLLRQGERSVGRDGCCYRGDGGTKCVIGMGITDAAYDPRLEGHSIPHTSKIWEYYHPAFEALVESGWSKDFVRDCRAFFEGIQNVHDGASQHEDDIVTFLAASFDSLGLSNGLDTSFIHAFMEEVADV